MQRLLALEISMKTNEIDEDYIKALAGSSAWKIDKDHIKALADDYAEALDGSSAWKIETTTYPQDWVYALACDVALREWIPPQED